MRVCGHVSVVDLRGHVGVAHVAQKAFWGLMEAERKTRSARPEGASGTGDRVVCPQRIRACVQTRECRCSSGGESAVLVRPRSWVRDPSSALDVHHPQIRAPLANLDNRCQASAGTWSKTWTNPGAESFHYGNIRGSFNGRTLAFKPRYEGSNPSPRAIVGSGQVNNGRVAQLGRASA